MPPGAKHCAHISADDASHLSSHDPPDIPDGVYRMLRFISTLFIVHGIDIRNNG
jgi:Fe2+ or Zn2+ uptake regulation protein